MKTNLMIFVGMLALLFTTSLQAQSPFEQKAEFVGEATSVLSEAKGGFQLGDKSGSLRNLGEAEGKKLNLPANVKVSNRPVILRHKGNCYQFACGKSPEGCDNCRLFWKDKNGDSKVQPRRELRCFCKGKKRCRIRVRKLRCQ